MTSLLLPFFISFIISNVLSLRLYRPAPTSPTHTAHDATQAWQKLQTYIQRPSHVFTLQSRCTKPFCMDRASEELHFAGCTHIVQFEHLQMLKAKCSNSDLTKLLSDTRRFAHVALDHRINIAAPITSINLSRPFLSSNTTNSAFEKITTLRFSAVSDTQPRTATAPDGTLFTLTRQKAVCKCSKTLGKGVIIYVIDTGCRSTHVQLRGRARPTTAPGSPYRTGEDDHGHGTHVATTIVGRDFGLAPNAKVVCIKALSDKNEGSSGDVIAGIEHAMRMHARRRRGYKGVNGRRVGIVSISLGVRASESYTALDEAVARAARFGLVSVVAAGNVAADACTFTPARAKGAITVAATDGKDVLAAFSNGGDCVTVAAPGVGVWSAVANEDESYGRSSGTSMAAPFVSGIIALIVGNEGGLRTGEIVERLRDIGWEGRERGKSALDDDGFPVVSVERYCRYEKARKRNGG